ncbi:cell wall metabolism sensor histidine kinase WalK [Ligilactobacillus acidipiscis]|uniref:cell wall metabolism sensor histidine kinase WalK n=1 Tax=Ligilactobacillus acidipiscis TaxID=89059 RepID=UPI000704DEC0|nr:cell wall metabolism sensor histidine kinase WalK [Ligilactobacillus acidipiscis]GAW63005.1 two-component system sensor histidine kinase [Ligilactobacillus acidipiscis]GEN20870.1 PAS domain-containing sensor histidine kinase [Ligilactobacillus acidipiscis]
MKKRLRIFRSIHFKIALVFVLLLLLAFQIVGAVFVQRLKSENLRAFKQRVELTPYVDNSLITSLSMADAKKSDRQINSTLTGINNQNISDVQVVDAKGNIRGETSANGHAIVGQKTTDSRIKRVLYSGRSFSETTLNRADNKHYYISITPLFSSDGNNNTLVGAVYLRADLESVYDSIDGVTLIFATAAVFAIFIGVGLAILISRAITRPIDEMKKQTAKIADGNYSGHVHVYGDDELGELAQAVNNLSVRVEESREQSESERRRLDSVLTHMSDGVLATDRRGNITIINDMAAEFLNVDSVDQLKGLSILDVLDIREDYTLRDLLENQDTIYLDMSAQGRDQVLNAYFSLIQRESGFISGLVCVLHDITEQQKIDHDRKQFVSNVSHELRTPLTSLRSYIEALNDGAWKDPEVAPSFLKVTQDETDRMIRMINDLLSLSRMDSGTAKLELELVNLNELFTYILDRFDMMIKNETGEGHEKRPKNYSIKREFTQRDLWVEIDPDKFIQVIDNIMNNAIKYSPDGGVITCRLVETHDHVLLSISDQGLGIPKKDLGRIFDRFFRVDKARSRAQGGTGLGLAISREVIEMHNGRIWVESLEGKGSTFYITLPYEEYGEEDLWNEDQG